MCRLAPCFLSHDSFTYLTWLTRRGWYCMCTLARCFLSPDWLIERTYTWTSCHLSMCLCVYVSMCPCVYVSMCLCVYVSLCLCVYVSMCLSVYVIFSSCHLSMWYSLSYVWHDSFIRDAVIRVTRLIHMSNTNHSYVWHDSFTCMTWLRMREAQVTKITCYKMTYRIHDILHTWHVTYMSDMLRDDMLQDVISYRRHLTYMSPCNKHDISYRWRIK